MTTQNPLSQLATILEKIFSLNLNQAPPHAKSVGGALLHITETELPEAGRAVEATKAYLRLLELAQAGQEFIDEHYSARAQERATVIIQNILRRLAATGPALSAQTLQHPNLSEHDLAQLRTLGDTMSGYDNIQVIPADDVTAIVARIGELEQFVRSCRLPNHVKRRLITSLTALRLDVQLMEFVDTRRMDVDVDAVIGSGVRALAGADTAEEVEDAKDFLERAGTLADTLSKWTELGTKALPLAGTMLKALGLS